MPPKKKRKIIKVPSDEDLDYFKIEDYKITDLQSLIKLTYDLKNKSSPPHHIKIKLPVMLYSLINILEPLESLNAMIGLDILKQQLLEQIIFFVQGNNDIVMLHTVIEGPPGTGKTTVANLMAEIYSGIGILKKNKCTIVKRQDLVGQYLGETTLKTTKMLDKCKNGVMLIDEAYSLGSGNDSSNSDSYAKEALDCINQYLTENVDKIICIIAGYKEELDSCFFSLNPGLRRRFPWTFTINKFTKDEITKIILQKIDLTSYTLSGDIVKNENEYLKTKVKVESFNGNGGDIESIISRAKIIYARVNFGKENDFILTKEIVSEAFEKFYNTRIVKDNKPPFMMYS